MTTAEKLKQIREALRAALGTHGEPCNSSACGFRKDASEALSLLSEVEREVEQARAAERERCAKVAEAEKGCAEYLVASRVGVHNAACTHIADRIRNGE